MGAMDGERIFNYTRYELATEPERVSVDIYDDGRVQLWVNEYKAWLEAEDREQIASLLSPLMQH